MPVFGLVCMDEIMSKLDKGNITPSKRLITGAPCSTHQAPLNVNMGGKPQTQTKNIVRKQHPPK